MDWLKQSSLWKLCFWRTFWVQPRFNHCVDAIPICSAFGYVLISNQTFRFVFGSCTGNDDVIAVRFDLQTERVNATRFVWCLPIEEMWLRPYFWVRDRQNNSNRFYLKRCWVVFTLTTQMRWKLFHFASAMRVFLFTFKLRQMRDLGEFWF